MRRLFPQGLPRSYWVLFWGQLVNSVGTSLVYPFLTVYLHERLGISMTGVGLILFLQGIAQVGALLLGGALADRWGRLPTALLSLFSGGLLTVALAVAPTPVLVVAAVTLRGMVFPIFGPAAGAMISGIVPKERLLEAYSLRRVAVNTGVILGPALGAFLVTKSFTPLFLISGAVMLAFGSSIAVLLRHEPAGGRPDTPTEDKPFAYLLDPSLLFFGIVTTLTAIVYSQLFWVLPGYLVIDLHAKAALFGLLATENGLFVVLLQLPTTRLVRGLRPEAIMAFGLLFYALGFGLMAFWRETWPFFVSVFVITLGENLVNPTSITWAAIHSTEDNRGRILAVQALSGRLGSGIGPLYGGAALDTGGGPLLWGSVCGLALATSFLYGILGRHTGKISRIKEGSA